MNEILKAIGLPFAYSHFAEGESPKLPYICYYEEKQNNFSADGRVYYKIPLITLEVYTDFKDLKLERKIEKILENVFYKKNEMYIKSERMFLITYTFEMEVKNGR